MPWHGHAADKDSMAADKDVSQEIKRGENPLIPGVYCPIPAAQVGFCHGFLQIIRTEGL